MRSKLDSFPVGATWEYVAPPGNGFVTGAVGRVWLERRHANGCEMWMYSFRLGDDRIPHSDWAPTRRQAVELCRMEFGGRCSVRFRRVATGDCEEE